MALHPGYLDTRALLQRSLIFGHLGPAELTAVEAELAPMWVAGGQLLFQRGDDSDALYLLKSGSLGAFSAAHGGAAPRLVTLVASGETVGVFGLLTRQKRAVDVRALRDSELLRLPRAGFDALVQAHPQAILGAAQLALQRLLRERSLPPHVLPRTVAVLPFDRRVPARGVAIALQRALASYGECQLLDAAAGCDKDSAWFAEREGRARFVIYLDEGDNATWRDLCRRQADALLMVVDARHRAEQWPDRNDLDQAASWHRPRYLLLVHPDDIVIAGAAQRWLHAMAQPMRHQHVRTDRMDTDLARLARVLTRHSIGLVLSGGGARGFAAIGVVRALREAGIAIDAVGGTSIGAIIGAGVALEWDDPTMYATYYHAFVEGRPLADRTFPIVAWSRGHRAARLLQEAVGDANIEDTPIPFFGMVANLTRGAAEVCRQGRLWLWLRASSAIPGVLPPVLDHGQVYVDGGVINNLPTDIMADDGLGRIIACDIGADDALRTSIQEYGLPPFWRVFSQMRRKQRPGLLPILFSTGMVNSDAGDVRRRELANLLLKPPMGHVGLLEWRAYRAAVDAGYRYAVQQLEAGAWDQALAAEPEENQA